MRRLLLLLVSPILLCSCSDTTSFVDVADNPVALIGGIKSYQTIDLAENFIRTSGYSWEVVEDSKLAPGDCRPPFDGFMVKIKGYKHLQQSGELVLHFFNNRLMSTWFYPNNSSEYLQALKEQMQVNLIDQNELVHSTNLRIWKYKDFENRIYIAWEDIRLAEEQSQWISSYS